MEELKQYREQIDTIDRQLADLFQQRMDVVDNVGRYKVERNMPVLDAKREQEVLAAKAALARDEGMSADLAALFENIMAISRRRQRGLVKENGEEPGYERCKRAIAAARTPVSNPKVVYQGVAGAYSEMACINFFGDTSENIGLEQFEDVFEALKKGEADYAVLPIENSTSGAIRQVYDLMTQYEYSIVGETTVRVEHCLMAPRGASLDTITHVYSHEQGLFQSDRFLNTHPDWVQVPCADTAGAGKYVARTGDMTKAAICSERAAALYGLDILVRGTNHNSNNTTRFVVVSPVMELREGADKISTVFSLPHEAGSLHRIMTIFAVNGLNMTRLESRPMPGHSWEYMFFLEFTGNLTAPEMDGILHELAQTAADFRVLGNFVSNL
ncbi:MAG: bifunctional chorismate mutase/prephenate dehydratase [Ruminococcaceae bacterium]|nr:bifunctional chorismate mutase/prephenate dehydratase [Oscillospiraceae bacterium]